MINSLQTHSTSVYPYYPHPTSACDSFFHMETFSPYNAVRKSLLTHFNASLCIQATCSLCILTVAFGMTVQNIIKIQLKCTFS